MKRFLTGLATGLAIGYLTAPRTGKETRDQLSKAADEQAKKLKEQWEKLKEQGEKTLSQAKELIEDVKSTAAKSKPKPEPNLFADMESGKMDKYLDKADITRRKAKEGYNDTVENTADAAQATMNKAKKALQQ